MLVPFIRSVILLLVGLFLIFICIFIHLKKSKNTCHNKILDNPNILLIANSSCILGIVSSLTGISYFWDTMLEFQLINPSVNIARVIDSAPAFFAGCIFLAGGCIGKKLIRIMTFSNDDSIQIEGTIVNTNIFAKPFPGYEKFIVAYMDPYEQDIRNYLLQQPLKKKDYPIGSKFTLNYSLTRKTAYDTQSHKTLQRVFSVSCFIGAFAMIKAFF